MTPETVIEKVQNNKPENGWAIFKYNLKYAISRILFRGLLFCVVLVMAAAFSVSALKTHQTSFILFTLVSVLFILVSVLSIVIVIWELFYSKKSMIVLTNEGVVKNFKNSLEYFPFDCITNLNATNQYSDSTPAITRRRDQYIDFRDKRTGKSINLVKNRIFGNPEPIFNILKSRITGDSFVSVRNDFYNN
ncbi:MAG: hypothetical protein WCK13_05745 [Ignavibacteriota bacterium]